MADITGIFVDLKTKANSGAGTDDHIYIGVFGRGGGGEFPLDVHKFNDFEAGSEVKYWFGDVWKSGILSGARRPFKVAIRY